MTTGADGARAAPTERFDVAVVGAGPAGLAAAFAAAAHGARVALVDRSGRLGGNVGNAFVHTICGLYEAPDAAEGAPRFTNQGLASAFASSLARIGAAGEIERAGRVCVLPIDPHGMARLAAAACEGLPSLGLQLATRVVAARADASGLVLETAAASGRQSAFEASVAIDASGDGDLAALLGAPTDLLAGERLQHPSYIVEVDGLEAEELAGFERVRTTAAVARAARTGVLPPECQSVLVRPALFGKGRAASRAFLTFTFPKPAPGAAECKGYDPLDASQREALARDGRAHAEAVLRFLVRTRPSFANARVAHWPERIGVREGRRLVGRVVLDRAHVLEGRAHPDEVARSSWPIELWNEASGARFEHPAGSCAIPLGALVSAGEARLGTAGRCLSATHEAHGALRVVGTAIATGEAVGVAAALAADAGTTLAEVEAAPVNAARRALAPRLAEMLRAAETRAQQAGGLPL